jgi:hypothetical protein
MFFPQVDIFLGEVPAIQQLQYASVQRRIFALLSNKSSAQFLPNGSAPML